MKVTKGGAVRRQKSLGKTAINRAKFKLILHTHTHTYKHTYSPA